MNEIDKLKNKLTMVFNSQKLAVLATDQKHHPYTSLVAFAASKDLKHIVFATTKETTKFRNISKNCNVSMFIDNRSNKSTDFEKSIGITAQGSVREIRKNKTAKLIKLYLSKHPELLDFIMMKDCAVLCMDVEKYHVVQKFQNVTVVEMA